MRLAAPDSCFSLRCDPGAIPQAVARVNDDDFAWRQALEDLDLQGVAVAHLDGALAGAPVPDASA